MKSDFLIVHKKILPDYLDKVIEARKLLENKECSTVKEAVKQVGISRNTYYKYKDYVYETSDNKTNRHAVISLILKNENGSLASVIHVLTNLGTSILTISQAIPIHEKANVLLSLDITSLSCSIDEMLSSLKEISSVRSVHLDAMEYKQGILFVR